MRYWNQNQNQVEPQTQFGSFLWVFRWVMSVQTSSLSRNSKQVHISLDIILDNKIELYRNRLEIHGKTRKCARKKVFASDVTKPPSCENQAHHCYTECTEHKGWYEEMHTVCLMLSLIWTMCKGWHLKPAPLLLFIIKKKRYP